MKRRLTPLFSAAALTLSLMVPLSRGQDAPPVTPATEPAPQIFLDKAPQIVAYQLRRLTNTQLIGLERHDDQAKYGPIYEALLSRKGMDTKHRQEAVDALAKINHSSPVVEIIAAVGKVPAEDKGTMRELVSMLMAQKPAALAAQREKIQALASDSDNAAIKQVAYAGLAAADGKPDAAWELAAKNDDGLHLLLTGLPLINDARIRESFYSRVEPLVKKAPDEPTRLAAIEALGSIPGHEAEAFKVLSDVVRDGKGDDRLVAARAIRHIPDDKWPEKLIEPLAASVVKTIQETPADLRTTPAALQVIQLGDDLTAFLPDDKAGPLRKTLRDLGVKVVALRTLREQMAYDLSYFTVEAGKPVQIVLDNEDAMPHNLVITAPGALQEVAVAGGQMPAPADANELAYVPASPKVLAAMKMVQPDESQTLGFTAPKTPGEYPFVCTFPGHWVRMAGTMLVVPDLDAWDKNPTPVHSPLNGDVYKSAKNDPNLLQAHQH